MGDIVEVVIQVGSTSADVADDLVTSVHGLDAIRQGGKKMNHTALCGYMAKSIGCEGSVETSEDDAVYVFKGDMREAARTFLLQLEKLPFHTHPESVSVNAGAWELRGEGTAAVCAFEVGRDPSSTWCFATALPPTRLPQFAGQAPRIRAFAPAGLAKAPVGEFNAEGLQAEWGAKVASGEAIYSDDVYELAGKHNAMAGKWIVPVPGAAMDVVWTKVLTLLAEGRLGYMASVDTDFAPADKGSRCVQVFTHDYTDIVEIRRVLAELRQIDELDVSACQYRLEAYAALDVDAGNQWGIKVAHCVASDLDTRLAGTCKFFDAKKGYGFILTQDGAEVYVKNYDVVKTGSLEQRSLCASERVEFSHVLDHKSGKPKAILVCSLGVPARPARGGGRAGSRRIDSRLSEDGDEGSRAPSRKGSAAPAADEKRKVTRKESKQKTTQVFGKGWGSDSDDSDDEGLGAGAGATGGGNWGDDSSEEEDDGLTPEEREALEFQRWAERNKVAEKEVEQIQATETSILAAAEEMAVRSWLLLLLLLLLLAAAAACTAYRDKVRRPTG